MNSTSKRVRLQSETGAFIHRLCHWRWFVTLTFEDPVSRDAAWAKFWKWIRRLAQKVVGAHITVAWAIERGPQGGLVHIHALMHVHANRVTPHPETIARAWPYGFAQVEDYRSDAGAAWYLVGDIEWCGDADWGIHVACDRRPSCRRRTCIEERTIRIYPYYAATQVRPQNGLPTAGLVPGTAV